MKRALLLFALAPVLMAGSCVTTREPVVRTVEVKVPVPVRCTPDLGPEPVYPDTGDALRRRADEAELAHAFRTIPLLLAGRALRIARDLEKTAALDACASP